MPIIRMFTEQQMKILLEKMDSITEEMKRGMKEMKSEFAAYREEKKSELAAYKKDRKNDLTANKMLKNLKNDVTSNNDILKGMDEKVSTVDKEFKEIERKIDEEDNEVIDYLEVQTVPAIDSPHLPESTEEECKSAKETRYVPSLDEAEIELDTDLSISEPFHKLVYYIRHVKETTDDFQKFTVEKYFKNQVKLRFCDEVKQSGTKTSIRVTSSPNSLCGIKVINKSITLLDSSDQLTAGRIYSILKNFDGGLYYGVNQWSEEVRLSELYKANELMTPYPWFSLSYEDFITAFETSDFIVTSNMIFFTRPCKSRGGGNIVYDAYAVDGSVVRGGASMAKATVGKRPPAVTGIATMPMKVSVEGAIKSVVEVRNYIPDTWQFDLEMMENDKEYSIPPGKSFNLKLPLKATNLGKQVIIVRTESAQSSDVSGSSEVSDALAKDAITRSLTLEPGGWPEDKLKAFCSVRKRKELPLFHLAYKRAVHEATGYIPSQMLFGRDPLLPCDMLFGHPSDAPSSPKEYEHNLQARYESVHNLDRERINLRTEKMKTRYDTKATRHQSEEGDRVWFYNPTRRKRLSPKLQSHWEGPYTVLKRINDVVIRIRKSPNSKPRVVHYDRLAPYYGHNN